EIARVVVVDRAPQERAQIARRLLRPLGRTLNRVHFGDRRARKLGLQAARSHRGEGNLTEMIALGHDGRISLIAAAKSSTAASMRSWCVRKLRTHTRPR